MGCRLRELVLQPTELVDPTLDGRALAIETAAIGAAAVLVFGVLTLIQQVAPIGQLPFQGGVGGPQLLFGGGDGPPGVMQLALGRLHKPLQLRLHAAQRLAHVAGIGGHQKTPPPRSKRFRAAMRPRKKSSYFEATPL